MQSITARRHGEVATDGGAERCEIPDRLIRVRISCSGYLTVGTPGTRSASSASDSVVLTAHRRSP